MKVSPITNTGISKYVKPHTKENLNKGYLTNIDIKNNKSDTAFNICSNLDVVSFGAQKTFVLEESQSIDSVKAKLYIGRKNSSAYKVEAARVILEDGARIRRLTLANKYFVPHFPLSYEGKIYDLNKTKVIMIGNAQLDSLKTNDSSLPDVARIYNGTIPKILDGHTYIDSINFEELVKQTENWVASDIKALSDQAAKNALKENSLISIKHYLKALSQIIPSINSEKITEYKYKGSI